MSVDFTAPAIIVKASVNIFRFPRQNTGIALIIHLLFPVFALTRLCNTKRDDIQGEAQSLHFVYLYRIYSRNFLTATEVFFLLRIAKPILRYAGTSNSFVMIWYGIRCKISCGRILIPNPLSTIDIMA